jgi:hypothetical protein
MVVMAITTADTPEYGTEVEPNEATHSEDDYPRNHTHLFQNQ